MAAKLGGTQYSSVSWTAGDVITEAKLDNMVANDQAYDSHAAQGLLLNNNKAFAVKDSGGNELNFFYMNTSDEGILGGNISGWVEAGETWTYASSTTFTVADDVTDKYQKGDKIRLKQGGSYKYFYIIDTSYSSPNTTITVTAGDDYSLANASITDNYYSKADNPQGFPQWFEYTPSYTGFSADPDTRLAKFCIKGKTATVFYRRGAHGTSNSTSFTISLPVSHSNRTDVDNTFHMSVPTITDNGSTLNDGTGSLMIENNASTIGILKDGATAGWTSSGDKGVLGFTVSYEI